MIKRSRMRKLARTLVVRTRRPFKVTCLDCGFLSLGSEEVSAANRAMLGARGVGGCPSLDLLRCSRSLWVSYDLMYVGTDADAIFEELEGDRRGCRGFLRYRPGWAPNEHRELLSKALETRQKVFFTILGTILGLLAAWVVHFLGWG